MKYCKYCDTEKPISEFHKNKKKKDGLADRCKSCRKDYHHDHYLKNSKTYVLKAKEYKNNIKKWFEEFKQTLKCENCNENRWWVLDFHHNDPNIKDGNVSIFIQNGNKKKAIEEIKKCKVLCANCHRDLHYKQNRC